MDENHLGTYTKLKGERSRLPQSAHSAAPDFPSALKTPHTPRRSAMAPADKAVTGPQPRRDSLAPQNPNNDKRNPRATLPNSLSCPLLARHCGKPVNFRLVNRGGIRQNLRRRRSGLPRWAGLQKRRKRRRGTAAPLACGGPWPGGGAAEPPLPPAPASAVGPQPARR